MLKLRGYIEESLVQLWEKDIHRIVWGKKTNTGTSSPVSMYYTDSLEKAKRLVCLNYLSEQLLGLLSSIFILDVIK